MKMSKTILVTGGTGFSKRDVRKNRKYNVKNEKFKIYKSYYFYA